MMNCQLGVKIVEHDSHEYDNEMQVLFLLFISSISNSFCSLFVTTVW